MSEESSDADLAEELVSACRTSIGDTLRSITLFTAEDYEQLYIREDLEQDAELDRFVANERLGFTSQQTYGDSELGEYEFTIRAFEYGYVTRIIVGDRGVYVTTDEMHMDEFDELATAVRGVLRENGGTA